MVVDPTPAPASTEVLDRITKLMVLANDAGATQAEAAAALGRVQHLMQKFQISDATVEARQRPDGTWCADPQVEADDIEDRVAWRARALSRWDGGLALAIAAATGTRSYRAVGGGEQTIKFFGLPRDLAVAVELYAWARAKLSQSVRLYCRGQRRAGSPWVNASSVEARSFKDGFCQSLLAQAQAGADHAADRERGTEVDVPGPDGPVVALVPMGALAEVRDRALDHFADSLRLRPSRSRPVYRNPAAFRSGQNAGEATSIERDVIA